MHATDRGDAAPEEPTDLSPVAAVPCAARPSTRFVHLDGPCRCFFGGPAPEFAPAALVDLQLTA